MNTTTNKRLNRQTKKASIHTMIIFILNYILLVFC